jgi:hypothetical protein
MSTTISDSVGSQMPEDKRLRTLEATVSELTAQVKFLLHVNGINLSALRTSTADDLLKFYQDAVQLLGLRPEQIPPEVVQRWSEIFVQLSEYEVMRLQTVVNYDHTWQPFYQLSLRMMTGLRQNSDFSTSVGMQHLYALLDKGRRNLRDIAVIMIERYPDTLSKQSKLLLQDGDLSESLQK